MKTISTLSAPRTGSTFFHEHIKAIEGHTYNAMEFFNEWNPRHLDQIRNVFFKYNEPFTESYQKYLSDLFECFGQRGRSLSTRFCPCYSFEMIRDVINILDKNKYRYFFHKCVHTNWVGNNVFSDVYDISDKIILLYRKDILNSYISRNRARKSSQWVNRTEEYWTQYEEKFEWNKEKYIKYAEWYVENYQHICNDTKKCGLPYSMLCYEDLYKSNRTERYKLIHQTIGYKHRLIKPLVRKQSRTKKQSDAFLNYKEFLHDYNNMKDIYKDFNIDEYM